MAGAIRHQLYRILAAGMAISRFYIPLAMASGTTVKLPDEAAHHAARVLRLKQGDPLVLFNGEGGEFHAVITHSDKRQVEVLIENHDAIDRESPLAITLVQAITSGERMDYAVQKAVELGVSQIVPVWTERTTIRLNAERAAKRVAHWQKVTIAACEQCGRNRVPLVNPVTGLSDFLSGHAGSVNWLLHPENSEPLSRLARPETAVNIIIGPEGGFSEKELMQCRHHGCVSIGLGPRILRMETAGPAVLAILQSRWGDL